MVTRLTIIYHKENDDGDASEQAEKSRRAETDSPRRSATREDPLEHRSSLSSPRGSAVGKRCGRNITRFIARILRRVLQYRGDVLAASRAPRDIGIVIARDTSRCNDRDLLKNGPFGDRRRRGASNSRANPLEESPRDLCRGDAKFHARCMTGSLSDPSDSSQIALE